MASQSGKRVWIIVGVVLAALLLPVLILVGLAWYKIRQDLSQPPLHASSQLPANVPTSVLALNVNLPFDRLVAKAEAAAPRSYSGSGDGTPMCVTKGVKVCSGTHYDFSATRGRISVAAGPANSLRITVPLQVSGHAGFRGDAARALHAQDKSFAASTSAFVDVALGMQQDWCPQVKVNADFSNLDARVEIAPRTVFDASSYIRQTVQQGLRKLGEQAASVIQCVDIRSALQDAWATRSFPLALLGDPKPLYVNLEPVSLGFSGVKLSSSSASFLISLAARVSVSDAAVAVATRPLPGWTAAPVTPGGVQLTVPLRISYAWLDAHLQSILARKPLSFATPRGPATIALDKFNVYPAGDRLAVGVHLDATFPDSFFDSGGWLYLTARPVLVPEGKSVHLADIGYSKLTDSELARMVTSLLDKEIRGNLASGGQFDLTDNIAKATDLVKTGLANGKTGLDFKDASIKLGRLVLGEDALLVEGVFSSGGDINSPGSG